MRRLRDFYRATRDFRLLAGLPDAVIGHTAGRVYPFLQGTSSVLEEIGDEATTDALVERISEVRRRAKSAVDRRALDLLEMLVERRAAEVLNQPGPHAWKALAAMRRAFQQEWSEGEPRLMADLLSSLGRIVDQELAAEQLRQLETLQGRTARGTLDRLRIGHGRARCLWAYQRYDEAIDLLQDALAEYQAAQDGVLPQTANGAALSLISYWKDRGHFARAETFLREQLEHPANPQQAKWLRGQLFDTLVRAFERDGMVSLGRTTPWPPRFRDVQSRISTLERQLQQARGKPAR